MKVFVGSLRVVRINFQASNNKKEREKIIDLHVFVESVEREKKLLSEASVNYTRH